MKPNDESPTKCDCSQQLQECQNRLSQAEEDVRKWQSTNQDLHAALDDSKKTNTIVVAKLQHMEGRLEATMVENMILKNNPSGVVAGENEKLHTEDELKECRNKLKEAHDQITEISARLNCVEQDRGRLVTEHAAELSVLEQRVASKFHEKSQLEMPPGMVREHVVEGNCALDDSAVRAASKLTLQNNEKLRNELKEAREREQQNHFTRCMEKMILAQQWDLKDRELRLLRTLVNSHTQQRACLMTEHMKEKAGFLASIQQLKRKATEKRATEEALSTHEREKVDHELQALTLVCNQLKTERAERAAEKLAFLAEIRDLRLKDTEWTLHKQRLEKELDRVKPLELERIRMVLDMNGLKNSLHSIAEDYERVKASVAAEIHRLTKEPLRQNQMESSVVIVQERERMVDALNVLVTKIEERKSAFGEVEIQELKRKAKVCTCTQKDDRLTNEECAIPPTIVPTQIEELRKEATMDAHEKCNVSSNLAGLTSAMDTTDNMDHECSATSGHPNESLAGKRSSCQQLDVRIESDNSSSDDDSIVTQPEPLICSAEGRRRQRTNLVARTPSKDGEETADSSDLSYRVANGLLTQVSRGTLEQCDDDNNNKRKVKDVPWWENFRRLKRFKTNHGHLAVTNDDNLVSWISEQRAQLDDDGCRLRVLTLNNIGFEWGKGHPFSLSK